jgi:transposase
MRGDEDQQPAMFSYVNLDQRVPSNHPLRAIRKMADQALAELSSHFDSLYARRGRPSIPPEQLIRALLLQVLYAIRSERQLMERIKYDLLFRWFVGLAARGRTGIFQAALRVWSGRGRNQDMPTEVAG